MNTITTWEEIMKRQANELAEHKLNYKDAFEKLQRGKQAILSGVGIAEEDLSPDLKDKLKQDEIAFKEEWGLAYGRRSKALGFQHQKELDEYITRQMDITKQKDRFASTSEMEHSR